jgi:hypothetical protein
MRYLWCLLLVGCIGLPDRWEVGYGWGDITEPQWDRDWDTEEFRVGFSGPIEWESLCSQNGHPKLSGIPLRTSDTSASPLLTLAGGEDRKTDAPLVDKVEPTLLDPQLQSILALLVGILGTWGAPRAYRKVVGPKSG